MDGGIVCGGDAKWMAPERCAQYTVAILSESVQAPLVETVYAAFSSVCVTSLSSDVMVLMCCICC